MNDDACLECNGSCYVRCYNCGGRYPYLEQCETCGGEGELECEECDGLGEWEYDAVDYREGS